MSAIPVTGDLTAAIEAFGVDDATISEADRPWIKHEKLPDGWWQPVRFDVRRGAYTFVLHIRKPGFVGRHQHHGDVFAYTLEGSWSYEEYPWVAEAGSIVHEAPGAIHTLRTDHPEGMKVLFFVNGAQDYFDEEGNKVDQESVFYFVDRYAAFCKEKGIEVDRRFFF